MLAIPSTFLTAAIDFPLQVLGFAVIAAILLLLCSSLLADDLRGAGGFHNTFLDKLRAAAVRVTWTDRFYHRSKLNLSFDWLAWSAGLPYMSYVGKCYPIKRGNAFMLLAVSLSSVRVLISRGQVWKEQGKWRIYILLQNRVRFWRSGRHIITKNCQE